MVILFLNIPISSQRCLSMARHAKRAYVDGNALVPVRFGLKHSKSGKNTLYVVVDQSKINVDDLGKTKNDRGRQDASPDFTESRYLHRSI